MAEWQDVRKWSQTVGQTVWQTARQAARLLTAGVVSVWAVGLHAGDHGRAVGQRRREAGGLVPERRAKLLTLNFLKRKLKIMLIPYLATELGKLREVIIPSIIKQSTLKEESLLHESDGRRVAICGESPSQNESKIKAAVSSRSLFSLYSSESQTDVLRRVLKRI